MRPAPTLPSVHRDGGRGSGFGSQCGRLCGAADRVLAAPEALPQVRHDLPLLDLDHLTVDPLHLAVVVERVVLATDHERGLERTGPAHVRRSATRTLAHLRARRHRLAVRLWIVTDG